MIAVTVLLEVIIRVKVISFSIVFWGYIFLLILLFLFNLLNPHSWDKAEHLVNLKGVNLSRNSTDGERKTIG